MKGDGSEMAVALKFESMDDFSPANVATQVEPLRKLLETRDKLRDLTTKIDRSDELESVLEKALSNRDDLGKLASELGLGGSSASSAGEPGSDNESGDKE
jgi:type VI secretion system protein ImpB